MTGHNIIGGKPATDLYGATEHAYRPPDPAVHGRARRRQPLVLCSCGWETETTLTRAHGAWADHVVDARYREAMGK